MPSAFRWLYRKVPPGRRSSFWMREVKPFGPHQCSRRSGSVSAFHTSSRGALKTRVTISARSVDSAAVLLLASILVLLLFRVTLLQLAQIVLEPVERFLPETAIVFEPVRRVF